MRDFDMVIFDCDGVLVDSEPLTNRALQRNLAGYGLEMSLAEIMARFVGGTIAGVGDEARAMGADLPDAWVDEMYAQMFDALTDVEAIPGAAGVLDVLDAAGIVYAVGSNGPHAKMKITLPLCGFAERLGERVYSREDVARPKPAPDVYLHAAREAGVRPERCVVVEDSGSGAQAGRAAGMFVAGFHAESDIEKLRPHCDLLFDRMDDLPGLLGLR